MSELAVKPWRTVRAPGADRPQRVFHTTRDEHRLWYNFEISLQTVRASGADRPQFILEKPPETTMSLVQIVK